MIASRRTEEVPWILLLLLGILLSLLVSFCGDVVSQYWQHHQTRVALQEILTAEAIAQQMVAEQESDHPLELVSYQEVNQQSAEPLLIKNPEILNLFLMQTWLEGAVYFSEGTYPNSHGINPYQVIVTYDSFTDFSDHPRRDKVWHPDEPTSDAAGICQFISTTWDSLRAAYPGIWYDDEPAFSPRNQDIGCAALSLECGAFYKLVKGVAVDAEGRVSVDRAAFNEAIWAARTIWASFPKQEGGSVYRNQSAVDIDRIWNNFQKVLTRRQSEFFPVAVNKAITDPSGYVEDNFPDELKVAATLNMTVPGTGISVSDTRHVRPVHPLTGAHNVWHRGVDYRTVVGTGLLAPTAGTVSCHDDGRWGTYAIYRSATLPGRYWLLHHLSYCKPSNGQNVPKGSLFAKTGACRNNYCAPHLHLEGWRWGGNWDHYDYPVGWFYAFIKGEIPAKEG